MTGRSRARKLSSALLTGTALAAVLAASALAAWSVQGSGHAAGAAQTMPAGNTPTARASGSDVTVTWAAATFMNGAPVAGYLIRRYNAATGVPATVGASCSGTITATTCTEHNVPAGSWTYTDTPVQQNWTGAESQQSSPVQVTGAATHKGPGSLHQPHADPRELTMPRGTTPTARISDNGVVVTWPEATFANGAAVAGYVIRRYDATTGAPAAAGAGCERVIADTTCTELDVPAGTWVYTDTPFQHGRAGAEGARSNPVQVAAPTPPSPTPPKPVPSPPTPAQGHQPPHEPAMPAGHAPTARVSDRDVVLVWTVATFPNGVPVAGYILHRYDAGTGTFVTVRTDCSESADTVTCTDNDVPAGAWIYTDTPVDNGRTGAESPRSNPAEITAPAPQPHPQPSPPKR